MFFIPFFFQKRMWYLVPDTWYHASWIMLIFLQIQKSSVCLLPCLAAVMGRLVFWFLFSVYGFLFVSCERFCPVTNNDSLFVYINKEAMKNSARFSIIFPDFLQMVFNDFLCCKGYFLVWYLFFKCPFQSV